MEVCRKRCYPTMSPKTYSKTLWISLLSALLAILLTSGCGSTVNGSSSGTTSSSATVTGPAFVIGTDAPLAGVTSFSAVIQNINAIDANGKSVPLLSGQPSVDFARFNGLQTLLDMNDVPADTYTRISVTLGAATIGYLQTQTGAPPTIQTMPAMLTTANVTQTLKSPLVVTQTGPVGIRLDLDLQKSIQVDGNGQITGQVTPTLNIKAVGPSDSDAYIDEFDAGVVSVDASGQSFIIQGPHGRQFAVQVNGQTEWDNNESLSSLSTSSIVAVSGVLDKADSTIDADEVAILSQDGFYAAGQITYVQQPASGTAAPSFDLYYVDCCRQRPGFPSGRLRKSISPAMKSSSSTGCTIL